MCSHLVGSAQEFLADWYHQGLDCRSKAAFMVWLNIEKPFQKKALEGAIEYGSSKARSNRNELEKLIEETLGF